MHLPFMTTLFAALLFSQSTLASLAPPPFNGDWTSVSVMLTGHDTDTGTCLKPGNPCNNVNDCCAVPLHESGIIECSQYPQYYEPKSYCMSAEAMLKTLPGDFDESKKGKVCGKVTHCEDGEICTGVMRDWAKVCHATLKYEPIRVLEGGYCHNVHTPCDKGLTCIANMCVHLSEGEH